MPRLCLHHQVCPHLLGCLASGFSPNSIPLINIRKWQRGSNFARVVKGTPSNVLSVRVRRCGDVRRFESCRLRNVLFILFLPAFSQNTQAP